MRKVTVILTFLEVVHLVVTGMLRIAVRKLNLPRYVNLHYSHSNQNCQVRIHEPQSTKEATKCAICILDVKDERADLQAVVGTSCPHLSLHSQTKCWKSFKNARTSFVIQWVNRTKSMSPLN